MCFDFDSRPPDLPIELAGAPIAGGAAAELLELESADGTRFSAAFAESSEGREPGVVILPDVRGLFPFYIELAEHFVQAGHHATAIDYYGRTAGLGPRGENFEYMPHREQVKLEQAEDDIAAAVAELRERTGIRTVVTVGFCFGGMLSFIEGASAELDLAGVVGLYGILDGSRFDGRGPLNRVAEIGCPVLGLFGGEDQAIPLEDVEAFDSALAEAGVDHEIHVYPGAPHSFFDKKQDDYASESEDAWQRILGFLAHVRERVA
jgi:carboxymethylenebutenolidase